MRETYLKQHYLDDHKLGQRALLEFSRALKSGRMIAFTGAMATEAFGYGSWTQLRDSFRDNAISMLKDPQFQAAMQDRSKAKRYIDEINRIARFSIANSVKMTANVAFSLMEEVLDHARINPGREWQKYLVSVIAAEEKKRTLINGWPMDDVLNARSPLQVLHFLNAQNFRFARNAPYATSQANFRKFDTPAALLNTIGIRRFATLNYDMELERRVMLPEQLSEAAFWSSSAGSKRVSSPFERLVGLRREGESDYFRWNLGSGRIRRVLADGRAVESDFLNRERIDRMIEFAIGTDDVDAHIFHLHGRACTPRSMIVSQRDYNRQYRNADMHRLPFEHAKRMLISGNPVLFVGLGMSEPDVNRELEEFISANPYRRSAPTFLLWNTADRQMNADERRMRRLDWLHKLGVLTIYDSDLSDLADAVQNAPAFTFTDYPERKPNAWIDKQFALFKSMLQIRTPDQVGFRSPGVISKWLDRYSALRALGKDTLGHTTAAERSSLAKHLDALKIDAPAKESSRRNRAFDRALRQDLATALACLPQTAAIYGDREEFVPQSLGWRTMARRINSDDVTYFWDSQFDTKAAADADHFVYRRRLTDIDKDSVESAKKLVAQFQQHHMLTYVGSSGGGRGRLAKLAVECDIPSIEEKNRLLINAGFSFDTDSLLEGVKTFLIAKRRDRSGNDLFDHRGLSRSQYFRGGVLSGQAALSDDKALLIVMSCMERFFGTDGRPLSAELDELLVLAAAAHGVNRVRWLFTGSKRVEPYFRKLLAGHRPISGHDVRTNPHGDWRRHTGVVPALQMAITQQAIGQAIRLSALRLLKPDDRNIAALSAVAPAQARELQRAIEDYRAQTPGAISGDIAGVRAKFFNLILGQQVQQALFAKPWHRELVIECIRALAFIGSPAEIAVVMHSPKVWACFDKHANEKRPWASSIRRRKQFIRELLQRLAQLGLVIRIGGFADYARGLGDETNVRFALHRSMLAEIRGHFGIPLSEAKLSTAFNMSLYVAQPVDGNIPEPEVHDELGDLIDRLIGSYKDVASADNAQASADWLDLPPEVRTHVAEVFSRQDPVRRRADIKNGTWKRHLCFYRLCQPEHIQCLRAALAVIRGYYSTTGILTLNTGDRLIREDRDGILIEHGERLDALIDAYGKVGMAREALSDAFSNAHSMDLFEAHFGKAEPFYADEMVWLHNERGVVRLAMGDLIEAKRSFIMAMKINRQFVEFRDPAHNWRRIRLNQLTVDVESGELDLAMRKIEEINDASKGMRRKGGFQPLREDELAIAIGKGYSGFIAHLRGHRISATRHYNKALAVLDRLQELRAQAYFARLRATTMTFGQPAAQRQIELDRAHDLALSTRQMDIAYRIQVMKAQTMLFDTNATAKQKLTANRWLADAHRYALHTDTFRVRCEAGIAIARARLATSDLEGALSSAMDAFAIALRNGLELRKMELRSLVATILAARGHPVTAEQLAMTSIRVASRQKIQWSIDQAEQALQSIPQVSSLSNSENLSGRRDF